MRAALPPGGGPLYPVRRMTADASALPTDRRILAVAEDHVRRFGMERTTVTSVAKGAGMTHANVYRYFPSKTALNDAVTALWLRELEALATGIADAPDPAGDKLERLLLAVMRAHRERIEVDPNLYDLAVDAFTENRPVARNHRARLRDLIERIVEEGVSTDVFPLAVRDRAIGLVFDLAYRFVNPHAIRLDRSIPPRVIETRHAAAAQALVRALRTAV